MTALSWGWFTGRGTQVVMALGEAVPQTFRGMGADCTVTPEVLSWENVCRHRPPP